MKEVYVPPPKTKPAPTASTSATPSTPQVRAARKPLPVVRTERDRRVCGHEDDFKILDGEKLEYGTRRREKWRKKLCVSCVAERTRIEMSAAAERRKERQGAFRLPDGAEFSACYDGVAAQWTGTLRVGETAFKDTCRGVLRLCNELGRAWRKSTKAEETPRA